MSKAEASADQAPKMSSTKSARKEQSVRSMLKARTTEYDKSISKRRKLKLRQNQRVHHRQVRRKLQRKHRLARQVQAGNQRQEVQDQQEHQVHQAVFLGISMLPSGLCERCKANNYDCLIVASFSGLRVWKRLLNKMNSS